MHYYQHNIGEFASVTRLFGPLEIGIAQIFIDEYVRTEKPLPSDFIKEVTESVATRYPFANESLASGYVSLVLRKLFREEGDGYVCPMLDEQLKKYEERAERNRQNASKPRKKQANPLKDKESSDSLASGKPVVSQSLTTNNQEPITNNQSIEVVPNGTTRTCPPIGVPANAPSGLSPASGQADLFEEEPKTIKVPRKGAIPPCPYQKIVDLYHEILPELPRVNAITPSRQATIKARWAFSYKEENCKSEAECLEVFKAIFGIVRESDFLMGRTPRSQGHSNWMPDFMWLMKQENFLKVANRQYTR